MSELRQEDRLLVVLQRMEENLLPEEKEAADAATEKEASDVAADSGAAASLGQGTIFQALRQGNKGS